MRRLRSGASGVPALRGSVVMPGDKSLTHRALIIASLAEGRATIAHANLGEDCRATATALTALGAPCLWDESKARVEVEGKGLEGLREAQAVIDVGNSGTSMRTLLGVCAGIDGLSVMTGDATVRARPMLRVVAPLRQMGASIDGRHYGDRAPLTVRGGPLTGIDIELPIASAQVKTALLIAGLRAAGRTTVVEPGPSRDHTERMLAATGVSVEVSGNRVTLEPPRKLEVVEWDIPGDISSALFLLAGAALIEGSEFTVTDVGLNPRRAQALAVMKRMGVDVDVDVVGERFGEQVGNATVRASSMQATHIGGDEIAALIDELPILAVLASFAEGETTISDASELRIKESDRIDVMIAGLQSLGVDCESRPDGMVVRGPSTLRGGEVDSHGDHRVAMSFAVAGLRTADPVRVKGWSCVDSSFPEFLDLLARAQGRRG